MMDLLDFIELSQPKSEKEIEEHFEILKQYFKEKGNIYGARKENIPNEVFPYLIDFEERGLIKYYSERAGITIPSHLRIWHTPDEAVEKVLEQVEEAYFIGDYQKAVGSRFYPHYEFETRELNDQYYKLLSQLFDGFARKLVQEQKALSYFMENESARGTKMNFFSEKIEKNVVRVASEDISLIQDYDDMKQFFKTHAFFCGLPTHSYRPNIKVPILSRLLIGALCEAIEPKDIALILSYTGGTWTRLNGNYKIIFPTGWDFMRVFEETSTPKAMAVIQSEIERLGRLHEEVSHVH